MGVGLEQPEALAEWPPQAWLQPAPAPDPFGVDPGIDPLAAPAVAPPLAAPALPPLPAPGLIEEHPPAAADAPAAPLTPAAPAPSWPPPEWAPDAVSGGELPPAPAPEAAAAPAQPPLGADDQVEVDRQRGLYESDPLAYAEEVTRRDAGREQAVADKRTALELGNLRQQQENADAMRRVHEGAQKRLADLDAAEAKVKPDMPIGQSIAMGIAAAISGYMNPTGPNGAVQMFSRMVEQNIAQQHANFANRRSSIRDLVEQGHDEYQAAEAVRMSALRTFDAQLASEGAKYDPRGTMAQKIVQARGEVAQKLAAARAAQEKEAREWALKLEEHALKQREADRADRSLEEQIKARRSADARGWASENRQGREFAANMRAQGMNPDGTPIPGWVAPEKPLSPSDKVALGKLAVTDIDGKVIGQASDEKRATSATEAMLAAHTVEQTIKRMRQLRKEIGTTTDAPLVGSWLRGGDNDARVAEYKSLQFKLANAIAKAEDPTTGVRDEERKQIIENRVPNFNTPFSEGEEAAAAKEKAIIDGIRGNVARHMAVAGVPGYKLSAFYDDAPPPPDTPARSASKAAAEHRAPVTDMGALNKIAVYPLLDGVAASMPVQALEQMAARGGDSGKEAVELLLEMSKNPDHPASAEAAKVLRRLGVE